MARRVIIDSSAVSPLKISVAGVDAATAQFNACIFDGNQPPLRLWGTGFSSIVGITWNNRLAGQNANEGNPIGVIAVPPGLTPVFNVMWRNTTTGPLRTPYYNDSDTSGSAGGGICSGFFCPLNFSHGAPGAPDAAGPTVFVNYCVFKNAN